MWSVSGTVGGQGYLTYELGNNTRNAGASSIVYLTFMRFSQ
jgi:hypothetical protein